MDGSYEGAEMCAPIDAKQTGGIKNSLIVLKRTQGL